VEFWNAAQFEADLLTAVRNPAAWVSARDRVLREHSWNARTSTILKHIVDDVGANLSPAGHGIN